MIACTLPIHAAFAGFERVVFWMFRLATYFILACATYIFLDIGIKGSRTVFTTQRRRSSTSRS